MSTCAPTGLRIGNASLGLPSRVTWERMQQRVIELQEANADLRAEVDQLKRDVRTLQGLPADVRTP